MGWFLSPEVDWLDTTHHPDDAVGSDVRILLLGAGGSNVAGSPAWNVGDGVARIDRNRSYQRISLSGACLDHLRSAGVYSELLRILADYAHKVTRLDVALDMPVAGADVVPALYRSHRLGGVRLRSRKALPVTAFLSTDPFSRETGSVYFGYRSRAAVTAKVYDKGAQVAQERGGRYENRTRYELTFRHGMATLRDASVPAPIFWHHVSPALLPAPPNVPEWVPGESPAWEYKRPEYLPAQRLKRLVEQAGVFDELAHLADQVGPHGREYLLELIRRRLVASIAPVSA